jgi:hypothetical protein
MNELLRNTGPIYDDSDNLLFKKRWQIALDAAENLTKE